MKEWIRGNKLKFAIFIAILFRLKSTKSVDSILFYFYAINFNSTRLNLFKEEGYGSMGGAVSLDFYLDTNLYINLVKFRCINRGFGVFI